MKVEVTACPLYLSCVLMCGRTDESGSGSAEEKEEESQEDRDQPSPEDSSFPNTQDLFGGDSS